MSNPVYAAIDDKNSVKIEYFDNGDQGKRFALEALWKRSSRKDPATGKKNRFWYRPTNRNMEVAVDRFMPADAPAGRYRVETFIPGRHATTRQGMFTIANNFRKEGGKVINDDTMALVNMYNLFDVWHVLGEFDLDPGSNPLSGRVRQYDLSLEDPPVEASYGPVRWVPLFTVQEDEPVPIVGGAKFDSPVGSGAERAGQFATGAAAFGRYPIWAGAWFDINPYLSWYSFGYHTGADLNLPGGSAADKGKPIYAVGAGTVTYAGAAGSWGNIVVIEHPEALVSLPSGEVQVQKVYTRYGHVDDNIRVKKGQKVRKGQKIAFVGLPAGQTTGWHLHFDVSHSAMLKSRPAHWPNMSKIRALQKAKVKTSSAKFKKAQRELMREVVKHYIDPLRFIKDNHR